VLDKIKLKLHSDHNLKELLSGSAITFVLKISGLMLGYFLILLISRNYGAEGVGMYSLMVSVIVFTAMLSSMGMTTSILRYVGQFNRKESQGKLRLLYQHVVQLSFPVALILSVGLYLFAEIIAVKFFHAVEYKHGLEIAAFIIPFFSLVSLNVEYIRGLKNLKVSEFLRSVNPPAISVTLLLLAGLYTSSLFLPLYTLAAATLVTCMVSTLFIVRKLSKIHVTKKDMFTKKELTTTSFPMLITSLSVFITGNISLFFLQIFSDASQVGIFSVILKISLLISLVLLVVNTIVAPKISELYWKDEPALLQRVLNQSTKMIFYISILVGGGVALFNKEILQVFGAEFIVGSNALYFLIVGQLVNAATGCVGVFFNMTGAQKILRNIVVVTMLLSVGLSYILIPMYGIEGAAFVSMMTAILANVTSTLYIKFRLGYVTYFVLSLFEKENG